ncbi:MAG: hypothetical protein M3022_07100 [Actinomycetota bacterium]|nr:hypothetical protein [Actinomycetota bacterium]
MTPRAYFPPFAAHAREAGAYPEIVRGEGWRPVWPDRRPRPASGRFGARD